MKVESPAFEQNQTIPKKHTCEGEDLSPPLLFQDIPPGTKSLVLIVDDPDASAGAFDHWIVWDLPGDLKGLAEGEKHLPKQGINGFREVRYRGPCPPHGVKHRYFFKLYALDMHLNLPEGSPKSAVEKAMRGHILGQAQLVGHFQR